VVRVRKTCGELRLSCCSCGDFVRELDFGSAERGLSGDLEVGVRVDARELGALDQAVEERSDFGSAGS
jgi:hypothetical protein